MIEARELRIGIYFMYSGIDKPHVLDADILVNIFTKQGLLTLEKMNPIPLTPEILINNCGFIKDELGNEDDAIYESHLFNIANKNNEWVMFTSDYNSYESEESAPFKYVHELQNLYYEWHREELIVNL